MDLSQFDDFYMVRDDGTATGDDGRYTTFETGSFDNALSNDWGGKGFAAADDYFYDSIETAMNATTQQTATSVILVSSAHSFTKGSAISLTLTSPPDSPIKVYSVNDTAVDAYLAGAFDNAGGTGDYNIGTVALSIVMHGVTLGAGDEFTASSDTSLKIIDGGLRLADAASDRIFYTSDGSVLELENSDLIFDNGATNEAVRLNNGATFIMTGGAIIATTGTLNDFLGGSGGGAGCTFHLTGVDCSAIPVADFIVGNMGSNKTVEGMLDLIVDSCEMPVFTTGGFVQETFSALNHYFLATNCTDASSEAEYQLFQRTWAGDVEMVDTSSIVRTVSTAFDGGEEVSFKINTVTDCGPGRPLIFNFLSRFAELSQAATDTMQFYFVQLNTQDNLDDGNCYAISTYPDRTTKNEFIQASNQATLLTTGTQWTDDSSPNEWEDNSVTLVAANYDIYRMDLAIDGTDGVVGADSVPLVDIYIESNGSGSGGEFFFDTTFDLVA